MQSISNRQLTLLRKLNRKKYRQKEKLFLVEGERAVEQVLDNGTVQVDHLFFDGEQRLWESENWKVVTETVPAAAVGAGEFREIADTETPQGVIALCAVPPETGREQFTRMDGIVVAVDRIRDPGNLGTIIRSAAWFGASGLLSGRGTVDLFHPKVVRSTAGATGSIPYRSAELPDDLDRYEREGWRIVLLDAGPASIPLAGIRPGGKTVLVIGNEAHGISKKLFKEERIVARIDPGSGTVPVESLNASIALSIALYALGSEREVPL